MKQLILLVPIVALLIGCSCPQKETAYKYEYLYKDLPFEMPRVHAPQFPDYTVSVVDFGAVGDGITLNTDAFNKAFITLSEKGGGKLVVPNGVWYTGPIVFQSNVNLYLDKGALILFSDNYDHYPLVETSFEGLDTRRCQSPITGKDLINVAITGEGSINGSGHKWRPLKKSKVTANHWKNVISKGGAFKRDDYWFPTEKALLGDSMSDMNVPQNLKTDEDWLKIKDFLRPVMVSFINCKNLLLQGVLFENSPSWNVHPLMCENVIIDNVFIRNPSYAQNGDGLDLESCKNSIIVDCTFDVGDDGICIKSGKDEDGRKRGIPTENVIVENCKVFKGHGGFVVGSEMSGGVKNIKVNNCQFLGTDVGLRFKSRRGRGGVVENIYISNISMFDILTESLRFNMYYGGKSAIEVLESGDDDKKESELSPIANEETPVFKDIFITNVVSRNARKAMFFRGLPEKKISNIKIENSVFTSIYGAELCDAENVSMTNVTILASKGEALELKLVDNFTQVNCQLENGEKK